MNVWLRFSPFIFSVCVCAPCMCFDSEDDQPFQVRDPKQFWSQKMVFQKRGIVIEDDDFIIRECFWVLDRSVVGQVVDVETVDNGNVFLEVRFGGRGVGWKQHGVNIRNRLVTKTNRNVTLRSDPYGDGTKIDVEEMTFSHRIEGEQVEPDKCGVVVRAEGDVTVVRFPGHLMSLVSPRKGDAVIRSFDWHDGFADGGEAPEGKQSGVLSDFLGIVERERDSEGFIVVRWQKTGRLKSHRFDHFGYYDVEKIP